MKRKEVGKKQETGGRKGHRTQGMSKEARVRIRQGAIKKENYLGVNLYDHSGQIYSIYGLG